MVGLGNVGCFRPAAVALLRAPRCGADWALRPVWHAVSLKGRGESVHLLLIPNVSPLLTPENTDV